MVVNNTRGQRGVSAAARRQNLICEFQGFLESIDERRPCTAPMMCFPCPSQPAIICLPQFPTPASGGNTKEQEEQKRRDDLEKLPRIMECATFEIRPTDVMKNVKDQHSSNVQYINNEVLQEMKNKQKKSENCPQQQMQQPIVCCLPCPALLQRCDARPASRKASEAFRPSTAPAHFICVPCPPQESSTRLSREQPRSEAPKNLFELRGGVFHSSCECTKRNGLQHDCPFTQCQGRPACLVKPEPDCIPSGGTGLLRPPPRVSNYPYVPPECEPRPQRERTFPKPDPCHRAAVDCDKCVPVLMCRPVCEEARPCPNQTRQKACPYLSPRNMSRQQVCPNLIRPQLGPQQMRPQTCPQQMRPQTCPQQQDAPRMTQQMRMCPEFASAKAQHMTVRRVELQESACPALQPMYQVCAASSGGGQTQQQACAASSGGGQTQQQACAASSGGGWTQQQDSPVYVCFATCP